MPLRSARLHRLRNACRYNGGVIVRPGGKGKGVWQINVTIYITNIITPAPWDDRFMQQIYRT